MKVGIDDLSISCGRRSLDFRLLVERGRRSPQELSLAGFRCRTIVEPWEDPVTLAAEAARPLLEDPSSIGLLLVSTETGLDYGKPISTYIHKMLSLNEDCRNAEIKHACYGTTMALQLACAWIRERPNKKALVIGSDIPRPQNGASELTAGAGAVAMIVSAEPRILEVESASGCASYEVWDVARPTSWVEHSDGALSLSSYLDLLEASWCDLQASTGVKYDDFRYVLYHCPLMSLVRRAHAVVAGSADDFDARVAPTLEINRELANIYGGSLYASLLGLLDRRDVAEGTSLLFFSYGSGACAEMWAGRIGRDPSRVRRHDIWTKLAARRPCTIEEWQESDRATTLQLTASELTTRIPAAAQGLCLTQITNWHRTYRWLP